MTWSQGNVDATPLVIPFSASGTAPPGPACG
jgi:hypothetical protein